MNKTKTPRRYRTGESIRVGDRAKIQCYTNKGTMNGCEYGYVTQLECGRFMFGRRKLLSCYKDLIYEAETPHAAG